jgi:hypothetical protein
MTFAHSKDSRVFANERHVSAQLTGWSVRHARQYGEATTIVDTGAKFIPGIMSGGLGLSGLFDSAQFLESEASAAMGAVDNGLLLTVCPYTTALGARAMFCTADPESVAVDAALASTVTLAVETVADTMVDMGVVLHDHAARTTDGDGTSVNRLASSANGAAASLHLTAYSGLTNIIVKIQDSPDNSAWSDLITFSTATGVTSQFSTVAGTVDQYVRASWDVTGTGSATFLVALGPR